MQNTTNFDDAFVKLLAKNAGANPHKCTASVQLSIRDGNPRRIFKYLNIYEDRSNDWNTNDVLVCSLLLEYTVRFDAVPKPVAPVHCIDDSLPF